MDVADYYRSLAEHRMSVAAATIADDAAFPLHITSHNALKDYDLMLGTITGPEALIFRQACREYQYSLEAVSVGKYRHAFSSLRLSFELFTAAIYFSAKQMKMHLWLQGHDDLHWATLTDNDKGVFSHNFVKAFSSELGPYRVQYSAMAKAVYRECSEYVHGNPGTHEDVSLIVGYDETRFKAFQDKASTVRLCVAFQFCARYLSGCNPESLSKLESFLLDVFGDLPEVQAAFGVLASE
jgi:hypothetical protein